MASTSHAALSSTPDPTVSSAAKGTMAPELKPVDRQVGWLQVNKWTYRPLRLTTGLVLPKVDTEGVTVTENDDAGPGVSIVTPDEQTAAGAVLLIHGGGYVLGQRADALTTAVLLAREAGVTVICNSYRRAPDHPFPAGLDDCHAAWHWLLDNAEGLGVDPAKIVVGGISAGGGHAAALLQRLHDEGGTQPAAQLLVYPMLDDRTAADTDLDDPRHRVWSNASNRFGWASYLDQAPGAPSTPPYAVPARRDDLSGLPPAWIGVGTADLFLDEDRAYAERLTDAGVDVTYVEAAGGIHAFELGATSMGQAFDQAKVDFVRRFVS